MFKYYLVLTSFEFKFELSAIFLTIVGANNVSLFACKHFSNKITFLNNKTKT